MKIAIIGYGIEGQAAYKYYSLLDNDITIHDTNEKVSLPSGVKSVLGDIYLKELDNYDLIIRSSGINPDIILNKNPGVKDKITTQVNEFLKICPTKNIIGVTGTKGKGTTSTLIEKMLEADNKKVFLGANIGVAPFSFLNDINAEDFVVLELSSFQLVDLKSKSPHVAVCLLVEPEHLDWHKDENEYISAKSNLFKNQTSDDIAIFYAKYDMSRQIAMNSPGKLIPYYKSPGSYIEGSNIVIDNQIICTTSEVKLLGKHNLQNVCAAVTASWQYTQNIDAIRSAIINFKGLEHRIEFVREVNGVSYYNDTFATGLKATEAAIEAINSPKVVIMGGYERGLKLSDFALFVADNSEEFRKILLIGQSAERLKDSLAKVGFKNYILANELSSIDEIVIKASGIAHKGDAIILSPGFASFDMFKNYADRGKKFKEAVNKL